MAIDTECIVFASSPVPGRCKTNLIAHYGPDGACAVHLQLTIRTIEECIAAFAPQRVLLVVNDFHETLRHLSRRHGIRMVRQHPGTPGQRRHFALHSALSYCESAILVGTDCPTLTASKLKRAASTLERSRMAFTPAEDGSYILVGASLLAREAFEGIPWETDSVMEKTRQNLESLGWVRGQNWTELPTEWRINSQADAERASKLGLLALPPRVEHNSSAHPKRLYA